MRRCLGCMREYDETFDLCPECGYVEGTPAESMLHLAPGTHLGGRYLLGKVLGQGGFGITYIAWDEKLDRAVAVKEYMPRAYASRVTGDAGVTCYNDEARQQFRAGLEKVRKETRTLAKYNDLESVVRVYDCIEANDTAYIIMELLRGQTVKQVLRENGAFTFEETVHIILPVLQTLQQIHRTGLIHRDISPDNIFLCSNGKVKLLDFGSARVVSGMDQKELSVVLKPGYAPKEQYSARGAQGSWTDLYSVAATMYKMLTGETPVDSLSRTAEDDPLEPIDRLVRIPPDAAQAIMDALAINPEDRTQTADVLLQALSRYVDAPAQIRLGETGKRVRNRGLAKKILCIAAAIVVVIGGAVAAWYFLRPVPIPVPDDPIEPPKVSDTANTEEYISIREEMLKSLEKSAVFEPDTTQDTPGYTRVLKDTQKRRTLTEYYAPDGTITSSILNIETESGKPESVASFTEEGVLGALVETIYDKNDRQELTVRYAPDGTLVGCEEYIYAENEWVQTRSFNSDLECAYVEFRTEENGLLTYVKINEPSMDENQQMCWTPLSTREYTYTDQKEPLDEIEKNPDGQQRRLVKYEGAQENVFLYDENNNLVERTQYIYQNEKRILLLSEELYDNSGTLSKKKEFTYKKDTGKLESIVLTGRDNQKISAWEYTYDEESGALTSIISTDYAESSKKPKRYQNMDGSYTTNEFDSDGELKSSVTRDAEDRITAYTNVVSASEDDSDLKVLEYHEVNEKEEDTLVCSVEIRQSGSTRTESTYDEDHRLKTVKKYTGEGEDEKVVLEELYNGKDKLLESSEYSADGKELLTYVVQDFDGSTLVRKTETTYAYPDGEQTVTGKTITEFYEKDKPKKISKYSDDGETLESEIEYYENGITKSEMLKKANGYTKTEYDRNSNDEYLIEYDEDMQIQSKKKKNLAGGWSPVLKALW